MFNYIESVFSVINVKGVKLMLELYGRGVSNGIAIGKLSFYSNPKNNIPKYTVKDTEAELKRYKVAVEKAKRHLQTLYDEACKHVSKNESVIFQTHIMMLEDSKFVETVKSCIINMHINAEYAVRNTAEKIAEIFHSLEDDYLRQRGSDIIDAANTVIEMLMPQKEEKLSDDNTPVIIAANELLPSETITFQNENLIGFVTNKGSKNSHTAILARTMGLPSVIQIKESLSNYDGMEAIIDGQNGRVIIAPDHKTITQYKVKQKIYLKKQQKLKNQLGLPSITKNGQKIILSATLSSLESIGAAKNNDAEGIGIFKSDYLFVNRNSPPTEEEQLEAYSTILKAFSNSEVVICLADLSSEKDIKYLDIPDETNPAIGYRGIRVLLSNNEFFMTQLRALYRASQYGHLSILLPMVNNIEEIEYVRRTVEDVKLELKAKGQKYSDNVKLGALINTPASAIISDDICRVSDFIAVGTSTLTQYTLAMDRENQKLEYYYEPYHKAILRLIRYVCENAHRKGKTVTICGELASDVYMTPFFLSLGIDKLSVVPSKLLDVKSVVRETDTTNASKIISKFV